jgi:hypothetical protein
MSMNTAIAEDFQSAFFSAYNVKEGNVRTRKCFATPHMQRIEIKINPIVFTIRNV